MTIINGKISSTFLFLIVSTLLCFIPHKANAGLVMIEVCGKTPVTGEAGHETRGNNCWLILVDDGSGFGGPGGPGSGGPGSGGPGPGPGPNGPGDVGDTDKKKVDKEKCEIEAKGEFDKCVNDSASYAEHKYNECWDEAGVREMALDTIGLHKKWERACRLEETKAHNKESNKCIDSRTGDLKVCAAM
jgi:hypothetical protein